MGRDVEKAKNGGTNKKGLAGKGDVSLEVKRESKESKRGWRDVFDNIDYTGGPGDNIYVFG